MQCRVPGENPRELARDLHVQSGVQHDQSQVSLSNVKALWMLEFGPLIIFWVLLLWVNP